MKYLFCPTHVRIAFLDERRVQMLLSGLSLTKGCQDYYLRNRRSSKYDQGRLPSVTHLRYFKIQIVQKQGSFLHSLSLRRSQ